MAREGLARSCRSGPISTELERQQITSQCHQTCPQDHGWRLVRSKPRERQFHRHSLRASDTPCRGTVRRKTVASNVHVPAGGLLIYSLKRTYSVHIPDPFDAVSFRIDQAALDAKAREMGLQQAPELSEPFLSVPDDVLLNLSKALRPALRNPSEVNSLFAEHVFDAILVHPIQLAARLRDAAVPQSIEARVRIAQELLLDRHESDVTSLRLCGSEPHDARVRPARRNAARCMAKGQQS